MPEPGLTKSGERTSAIDFQKLGISVPDLPQPLLPVEKPNLVDLPKPSDYVYLATHAILEDAVKRLGEGTKIKPILDNNPPSEARADFSIPCHPLASIFRKPPQSIAEEVAEEVADLPNIRETRAVNGFVNIEIDPNSLGNQVLHEIEVLGKDYGRQNIGNGNTVVIDCSSPNIAKEMSIGHLRSTIIGESLARIYRAAGYTVVRDNHLGDWGTQFGMLGEAYGRWKDEVAGLIDGPDPVKGLNKLYVKMNDAIAREGGKESALYESGKRWFQRLEQGDPQAIALWRWATSLSLTEFQRVYDLLGTKYEYVLGESQYVDMLSDIVRSMVDNRVATKDAEGTTTVHFADEKLGKLVVQKSDGTSVYATRDLAALAARTEWFNPERILYVVGGEQKFYFQQLFEAFSILTGGKGPQVDHVSFGMVKLGKEKMSTRKGRVVLLEDLLTESIRRAKEKILQSQGEKGKIFTDDEIDAVAKQVGVGAVVFLDLAQSRERQIALDVEEELSEDGTAILKPDWDKILSFEGNSAPHIQYAHARARSILGRAHEIGMSVDTSQPSSFETQVEESLIKQLGRFPAIIQQALTQNEPYLVSDYAYRVADLFNQYYKQEKVISEPDPGKRNDRLRLTAAAAQVIENSLELLCIEAPEKM